MKLRVCHVISGDLWAGAEVMAFHLLKELKEFPGLDLSVILLNRGRLAKELEGMQIPFQLIDEVERPFPEIVWAAAAFLRKTSPHVLHSHRYKENILAFLLSSTCKKRLILVSTQHGMPEFCDQSPSLLGYLKSKLNYFLLASRFDKVVAVSLDVKQLLMRIYKISSDRVEFIHNGQPIQPVFHDRVRNGRLVIGSAGRFFPVKDYPFMVDIARVIVTRQEDIFFKLAGEGPELERLQKLIATYGLSESFHLCGQISQMDSFYNELDIYLNTSRHEGIPMSILEAMAHGLPVIAPKVGGIVEIIEDGVEGFLVPWRTPEDFAEKCFLLQNAGLRQKMGKAARAKIERAFSAQAMAQEYHRLYQDLAKQ